MIIMQLKAWWVTWSNCRQAGPGWMPKRPAGAQRLGSEYLAGLERAAEAQRRRAQAASGLVS